MQERLACHPEVDPIMITPNKLTERAQEAFQLAYEILQRMSHSQLDVEHLFLALLEQTDGTVPEILRKLGIDVKVGTATVEDVLATVPKSHYQRADDPGLRHAAPQCPGHGRRRRVAAHGRYRHRLRPPLPGHRHGAQQPVGAHPARLGVDDQKIFLADSRDSRRPEGHRPGRRVQVPRPGEVQPRPDGHGPRGQARSRHRPRRGHPAACCRCWAGAPRTTRC